MIRKVNTDNKFNKRSEKWEISTVCLNSEVGKAIVWFRNDDKNSLCQLEGLNWGIMKKVKESQNCVEQRNIVGSFLVRAWHDKMFWKDSLEGIRKGKTAFQCAAITQALTYISHSIITFFTA